MRQTPLEAVFLTAMIVLAWSFSPALAQGALAPLPVPFTATLGADQLTVPVDSSGSGEAMALLIGNDLVVTGSYRELTSPLAVSTLVSGANLRRAAAGEDGPTLRLEAEQSVLGNGRTMSLSADGGTSGRFSGVFTLTDAQVGELAQGLYYLQLYTEANPAGELRGQLGTEVVLDVADEDFVGIWRALDGTIWQIYADGTWTHLDSLAEVGEVSTWEWRRDGDVLTFDLHGGSCDGRYVHREALYRDGSRRWFYLEDASCASDGTWHHVVKIDEEGNRVPLRE